MSKNQEAFFFLAFIILTVAKNEMLARVEEGSWVPGEWNIWKFHWSKDFCFLRFHIRLYITKLHCKFFLLQCIWGFKFLDLLWHPVAKLESSVFKASIRNSSFGVYCLTVSNYMRETWPTGCGAGWLFSNIKSNLF